MANKELCDTQVYPNQTMDTVWSRLTAMSYWDALFAQVDALYLCHVRLAT
jgi:hypothetical protein